MTDVHIEAWPGGQQWRGGSWVLAVLQDGTDGVCHALGLPALYGKVME